MRMARIPLNFGAKLQPPPPTQELENRSSDMAKLTLLDVRNVIFPYIDPITPVRAKNIKTTKKVVPLEYFFLFLAMVFFALDQM